MSLVIEPSGPASAPLLRFAAARSLLKRMSRLSMYACARRCRALASVIPRCRSISRERDPPTLAFSAEAHRVRDANVVEEHLVELGVAGDLHERPYGDARRLHV